VSDLFLAEVTRQVRRRGSVFGSAAFIALFAIGELIWVVASDADTRADVIGIASGLLLFAVLIPSVVIGAIAGSYDTDKGTMRYLVLTGRPRWQLTLVRVPALLVTIVAAILPAYAVTLLAYVLSSGPAAPAYAFTDLFYGVPVAGFLFGILSLAIGTFLRSSAVAIAVALVLNFASAVITGVISEYVSETLAEMMFPVVVGVVFARQGSADTLALAPSALVLAAWLFALLAAAVVRVERSEF
jgi:ABC-type transport system involved in multi-copper enzyme maturation permease subunit